MRASDPRRITELFSELRRAGLDTWRTDQELGGIEREGLTLALRALTIYADAQASRITAVTPAITAPRSAIRARRISIVLDELLRESTNEIVVLGYELSDRAVLRRLAERASVGVRVELMIDPAQTSVDVLRESWPIGAGAARLWTAATDEHGRSLRLHAKAVIGDGDRAIVGSANLTSSGLRRNLELAVALRGPAVAQIRTYVGELIDRGFVVDAGRLGAAR